MCDWAQAAAPAEANPIKEWRRGQAASADGGSPSTTKSFLSDRQRGGGGNGGGDGGSRSSCLRLRLAAMAADSQSVELLKRFCDCTSAHGFHKIFQTASVLHRAVWLLIITAAVTGFSIHLFFLISRFFQSPVNTETQVYSTRFVFPDVTVCSTSQLSRIRFESNPPVPSAGGIGIRQLVDRIRRFWDPAERASSSVNGDLRNSIKSYLHELSVTKQRQETIVHCHYAGNDCSYRDFKDYVDPEYFSCYTFVPPTRHLIVGGEKDGGLMVVLYAGDGENFITDEESLSFSKGYRVIIHEPDTRPNMMEGFYIQQATNTYVQLSYTEETVLSKKTRRCIEEEELPNIEFVDRYGNRRVYKYTITDCSMDKYQEHLNTTCRCLSEMLPMPVAYAGDGEDFRSRFCHRVERRTNESEAAARERRDCHDEAVETIHKLTADGQYNCSIGCTNLKYDMRLTQNAWPSDSGEATRALLKAAARTEAMAASDRLDLSVLHEMKQLLTSNASDTTGSFLKLNVYSHSTMGNKVVENWAYPARNLFSDIGGILGLWLGVSIISTFEFLELFIHLVRSWSSAKRKGGRQQQGEQSDAELQRLDTVCGARA